MCKTYLPNVPILGGRGALTLSYCYEMQIEFSLSCRRHAGDNNLITFNGCMPWHYNTHIHKQGSFQGLASTNSHLPIQKKEPGTCSWIGLLPPFDLFIISRVSPKAVCFVINMLLQRVAKVASEGTYVGRYPKNLLARLPFCGAGDMRLTALMSCHTQ